MPSPIDTIIFQATGTIVPGSWGTPNPHWVTSITDPLGMLDIGGFLIISKSTGIYLVKIDIAFTLATPDNGCRVGVAVTLQDATATNNNSIIAEDIAVSAGTAPSFTAYSIVNFISGCNLSTLINYAEEGSALKTRTCTATITIYGYDGVTGGIQVGTPAAKAGYAPGSTGVAIVDGVPLIFSFNADPTSGLPNPDAPFYPWQPGILFEGNNVIMHEFGGANPDRVTIPVSGTYHIGYCTQNNYVARKANANATISLVKNGSIILDTKSSTYQVQPIGPPPPPTTNSVVDVNGTAVTWVSGDPFVTGATWVGEAVLINGFYYLVFSVTDNHNLVLYSPGSVPSVQTGVVFNGPTTISSFATGDQRLQGYITDNFIAGDYLQVSAVATSDIGGTWSGDGDFSIVLWAIQSIESVVATGNILVRKITNPAGSLQVFNFTTSYGSPFTLTDGQENDSGALAPGTYTVTEVSVTGWVISTNIDPTAIVVVAGETTIIVFTNTYDLATTGLTLVGDYAEGIGHDKVKWDKWTYFNKCRLLSAATGQLTHVVNILPSGKIIKLDPTEYEDYVDVIGNVPIYHYGMTAGFYDEEDMINFLYAIVARAIGEGLLHISVMQMDDEFKVNPENKIEVDPVMLELTPGKVIQVNPKFEGEKYYILFEAQILVNNVAMDVAAHFTISRLILYSTPLFAERPQ